MKDNVAQQASVHIKAISQNYTCGCKHTMKRSILLQNNTTITDTYNIFIMYMATRR